MSHLTNRLPLSADISRITFDSEGKPVVTHTQWLKTQVSRLRDEIRSSHIFESDSIPTREELDELKRTVVIYRFLEQELRRREPHVETLEIPLAAVM